MNRVNGCGICKLIGNVNPFIETDHWLGYVKSNQSYLGQSDFLLKRHTGDLALLSDEELIDFRNLVKTVENAMKSAFSAQVFNWTCLMNNAYQQKPPQPHVHWHLKPRYDRTIALDGIDFTDNEYGYHYDESKVFNAPEATVEKIHDTLAKTLSM